MAGGQGTESGLITQQIIADIRDMLQDFNYAIIPNDAIILNSLNKWQTRFMIECKTTRKTFNIELMTDLKEYSLDDSIISIIQRRFTPERLYMYDWTITGDTKKLVIYNPEIIQAGDSIEIDAYIKPKSTEKISKVKDPVIQTEYHTYLKDGVLSEIPTYTMRREAGDIIGEVTLIRNKLMALNAEATKKVKRLRF